MLRRSGSLTDAGHVACPPSPVEVTLTAKTQSIDVSGLSAGLVCARCALCWMSPLKRACAVVRRRYAVCYSSGASTIWARQTASSTTFDILAVANNNITALLPTSFGVGTTPGIGFSGLLHTTPTTYIGGTGCETLLFSL